jgi:uncharacterized membrane protein
MAHFTPGERMTDVADPEPSISSTDEHDASAPEPVRDRRWPRFLTYNFFGVVWAFLLAWQSFTPSLIPRTGLFQGLVAGVAAVIGYLVGLAIWWTVVQFTDRRVSDRTRQRAWRVLLAIGLLGSLAVAWAGRQWQAEVRQLMDMPDAAAPSIPTALIVAVVVFVVLVALGRGIRRFFHWVMRQLQRFLPVKIAKGLALAAVAVLLAALVNDVIVANVLTAMDETFATANRESFPDTGEPTAESVSGGPASGFTWESLGRTGRDFVAGTPSPEEITAYTAEPAASPVRAYAGLEEGSDARDRAAAAVSELERLGGFDRDVLIVGNTTGSGWVDDQAIWPLEFMYDGDTATVAMQYSYLPSWLSFLVDKSRAQESGRALFDAVYGVWIDLPEETRPKLVIFGESLGSFGGETAFSGSADMANRTDGIVFMGPPNDNRLWTEFQQQRAPGSPQWQPVYDDGLTVRFVAEEGDFDALAGPWNSPRVLYIQHASDPITWWSPNLLLTEPEWLEEEPGPDRSPAMRWIPFVTFFQVSADLAVGNSVPDGHGHKFGLISVDAWADVLPPEGWTADDTASLRSFLAENPPDPIS